MSRKKIKRHYEYYYSLTPAACEALGLNYDELRVANMADIMRVINLLDEGKKEKCNNQENEEEDQL